MDSRVFSPSPTLEYSGTVWALAPLTGLLLLHPDGSIYSIQDHFALSLFGYTKDELLQKVSRDPPIHHPAGLNPLIVTSLTAALPTEHCFPDAWFL